MLRKLLLASKATASTKYPLTGNVTTSDITSTDMVAGTFYSVTLTFPTWKWGLTAWGLEPYTLYLGTDEEKEYFPVGTKITIGDKTYTIQSYTEYGYYGVLYIEHGNLSANTTYHYTIVNA